MHVRSPPFHPPTSTHLSSPSYQPSFSQSDTSFFLEFRAYCWNELASDGDGGIVGGCSGLGQFLNSGSRMFLWICAREMERLSYLSLRISHLCSLSLPLSPFSMLSPTGCCCSLYFHPLSLAAASFGILLLVSLSASPVVAFFVLSNTSKILARPLRRVNTPFIKRYSRLRAVCALKREAHADDGRRRRHREIISAV